MSYFSIGNNALVIEFPPSIFRKGDQMLSTETTKAAEIIESVETSATSREVTSARRKPDLALVSAHRQPTSSERWFSSPPRTGALAWGEIIAPVRSLCYLGVYAHKLIREPLIRSADMDRKRFPSGALGIG
jgi:hypothetical protein